MQDAALRSMQRRLSSGAMPRRASMEHTTLHTIGERSYSSINDNDDDSDDRNNQEPEGHRMQRRRSSVSFSSTNSVREYNPEPVETVSDRFYSPEDIRQFRREYRQERRMARRNSTGSAPTMPARKEGIASLTVGLNPHQTADANTTVGGGTPSYAYPYISPYALTTPSTSNHYFSSDSVRTSIGTATTSGPYHTNAEEGNGNENGPVMTFSSSGDHCPKKTGADPSSTCITNSFHPRYQRRHSVGPIQAAGFTVPIDQIRTVIAGGNGAAAGKDGQPPSASPHDLASALTVSVSCPMPRRPSTAGIA